MGEGKDAQAVQQQQAPGAAACAPLASGFERLKPPQHPVSVTPTFILVAAVIYGVLFFGLGRVFLPGNAPFAVLLIWIVAIACADVAAWARLPRVVGMLLGGLLLMNVPGSPLETFPPEWGSQIRAAGLATIYLRCGLVLEWKTLQQYQLPAMKLALIPGLVEMCFDAGVAVAVFRMPVLLAFTLGSLLQAVGPALLVPLLFNFQQQRLGTHEGAPQSAIVAASFDDIVAITWFSIFSCLAITGQDNLAWDIARGPVQVVIGVAAGVALGCALGCTRVWDTERKRVIVTYFAGLLIMFCMVYFNMLSGGALGALVMGMTASYMWKAGLPRTPLLGLGPAPHFADDLEQIIAQIWDWVAEPMIFGSIGASINFSQLPASVVGRAALIVVTGLAVRMIATYITMFGREGRAGDHPYSHRSRLFFAVAWSPKATVQAALSAAPLHLVRILKKGQPDYEQWMEWGREVQATGVICILICATLGTLLVQLLGPKLLDKAPHAEEEQEQLAAIAAKTKSEIGFANPSTVQGSALEAMLSRYLELSSALARAAAPDAAPPAPAPLSPLPRSPRASAAGAAAGGGAGGAAGAAAGDMGAMARELILIEEHIKRHFPAVPLSVRRALELERDVSEAGGAPAVSDAEAPPARKA